MTPTQQTVLAALQDQQPRDINALAAASGKGVRVAQKAVDALVAERLVSESGGAYRITPKGTRTRYQQTT